MYNVIIKDFASLTLNRTKNLLTIKFFGKNNKAEKFSKLSTIINELSGDNIVTLIVDFSNSNIKMSDIQNYLFSQLDSIKINKLIIVNKSRLNNTFINIFHPFSIQKRDIPVHIVTSFEQAIILTN